MEKLDKKIGFVIPWYSEKIPGGAEMALRGITTQLHSRGVELEILTTCVKEFSANWNENYFKEGVEVIHGFNVRRFKVRKRDTAAFDGVNGKILSGKKLTAFEQEIYVKEMVNSPALYKYIEEHKDEYSVFVFIPYMFGTTYYGMQICPEKSVAVPCFHDEPYVYLKIFKPVFENAAGLIYNADPECDLANKVFNLASVRQEVVGVGVDVTLTADAERFREKFGIKEPFIL